MPQEDESGSIACQTSREMYRCIEKSFGEHTCIAQAPAQSVQLVAVKRAPRGVAADRLPHLRGARRALHRAWRLVELQTSRLERQLAELQQTANFRLGIGYQGFIL